MPVNSSTGWSVMGTGTIATERAVAAIRAVGHSPLWVVSRKKADAEYFAKDLDIPRSTTNLEYVFADPEVEFAYVSAELKRRAHYISASAQSRKNVLCDGPISQNSRTAAELVHLCEEAGIILAVNHPFRASTVHQTMRRLIMDGDIGAPQSILLMRGGPYKPAPNRRVAKVDVTGDVYLDMSVDDVDLARFLTGAEPSEVSALGEPRTGKPAQVSYALRFDNGVTFQAFESFRTAEVESLVLVAGSKGTLVAHGTLNGRNSGTLMRHLGGRNEFVPVRNGELLLATVEDFVAARDRKPSWVARGSDNVIALRAVEAVAASAQKRRAVEIAH